MFMYATKVSSENCEYHYKFLVMMIAKIYNDFYFFSTVKHF